MRFTKKQVEEIRREEHRKATDRYWPLCRSLRFLYLAGGFTAGFIAHILLHLITVLMKDGRWL